MLKYKDFPNTYLVGITAAYSDTYPLAHELRTQNCQFECRRERLCCVAALRIFPPTARARKVNKVGTCVWLVCGSVEANESPWVDVVTAPGRNALSRNPIQNGWRIFPESTLRRHREVENPALENLARFKLICGDSVGLNGLVMSTTV